MTSLEELAGQVHRQALDTAVRQVAPELGVRPDELLDSRSFLDTARQLDPGSPAFTAGIREAAKAAAEREPGRFLAAPPQPAAAPGDDPDGPPQWTMEDVNCASPAELNAAIAAGQMMALGVPPPRHRYR